MRDIFVPAVMFGVLLALGAAGLVLVWFIGAAAGSAAIYAGAGATVLLGAVAIALGSRRTA